MATRTVRVLIAAVAVLAAVLPVLAQAEDAKVKELQDQKAQLEKNLEAAEQLLATNPPQAQKEKIQAQVNKFKEKVAAIEAELAKLIGPAPGQEKESAVKGPDAKKLKEIRDIERQIKALLQILQARAAEIAKTPPDLLLEQPAVGGAPGAPGAPGGPGAPPAPGVVAPPEPGAAPPAEPGMAAPGAPGAEGVGGPPQPTTVRGKLEQDQKADLAKLAKLQARLAELKSGKVIDPLAADNIPELHPLVLYGGKVEGNPHGLKVGAWGSGTVSEAEEGLADGIGSLLVYTDGYYRGARFDFATPPEIESYFEQPELSYLQMDIVFFAKPQPAAGPAGGGEAPPEGAMPPGDMPPGPPPPGAEAQPPGMAAPAPAIPEPGMAPPPVPAAGGVDAAGNPVAPPPEAGPPPEGGAAQPAQVKGPPATRSLRIILDTDRGPVVVEDFYFDYSYEVHPGWTRVFVPIKSFILVNERKPSKLNRLRLFGDTKDAFYVGQVRLVTDGVPIRPQILGPTAVDAVVGQEIKLECVVEAGLSVVDYVWEWGDGDSDETTEPLATHLYVKAGEYQVKLTARDKDKLKEPGTTTVTVKVKPFAEIPRQPRQPAQPGQPGQPAPPGPPPR